MKWTTMNYKGERVTWYSEDVIFRIKELVINSCCMTDKDICNDNSCSACESVFDEDVIKKIILVIESEEQCPSLQ